MAPHRRASTSHRRPLAGALTAALAWTVLCCAPLPAGAAENITLNLKEADIQALIDTVSDVTGKNFVVDPRVKGQVTVVSARPMGKAEIYEVFQSILDVHGFATVESGDVVKIIPDVNAKQLDTPTQNAPGREDVLTRVLHVDHVPAAQLVPILRPLLPQQGHLAAYPPTNTLIVSDRAGNVDRIARIIDRIDQPGSSEVEVVPLEHASAGEIVRILSALDQQSQAQQGQGAGARVTYVADERTNSVLLSGDEQARMRKRAVIAHLDTPLEAGGNTHVVYLRYAKAEDLVPVLEGVTGSIVSQKQGASAGGQSSQQGETSIQADESTNALVINAPPDVYRSLRSVIDKLDVRRAQVLVEAIIAEISATKAADLGLQWAFDGTAGGDNDGPIGLTAFGGTGNNIIQLQQSPQSIGEGLSVGVGSFDGGDFEFGVLLRALASDAATNILSTPSLVTLDNAEAEIVVGQNVPFVTGQFTDTGANQGATNPFQTIERQDVGITLKVTPQINEGNAVKLEISQEVSSLAPSTTPGAADLITQKRSIKTSVLVEDGQLVILGGLVDEDVQESITKVPGLGDIPILGHLFRFQSTDKTKRNLMIFLRPVIMRNQQLASNISSGKYSFMRAEQLRQREEGVNLMPGEDTPLLPPSNKLRELPEPFGGLSSKDDTEARDERAR